jgi:hypothetical protein
MTMQALVIAHACYGHNSFFKGNYLFKTWTDASAIIDYLVFAKQYIAKCEERHGVEEVESVLDSCHALMNYGVNRYKRPKPLTAEEEQARIDAREEYNQRHLNQIWNTIPKKADEEFSVAVTGHRVRLSYSLRFKGANYTVFHRRCQNRSRWGIKSSLVMANTPLPPLGKSTQISDTSGYCSIKCTSLFPTSTTSKPPSFR